MKTELGLGEEKGNVIMIRLKRPLGSYIIELKVKVKVIEAEIRRSGAMGAMEQNRKLILELVDVCYKLGRAYQQKGDAKGSEYYFARAQNIRK